MELPGILSDPPTFNFLPLSDSPNANAQADLNPPADPVKHIKVPFSDHFVAEWEWTGEGANGRWMRSMDGPTLDGIDDTQVSAVNVVVLCANHLPDPVGGTTWEINLAGSGRGSVFTQGGRIDGDWYSDGLNPPRFTADNGQAIRLTPGNTWFQVVPPGVNISSY